MHFSGLRARSRIDQGRSAVLIIVVRIIFCTPPCITGTLSAKAEGIIEVEVIGQNERLGTHMTGVVSIALPQ